MEQELLDVTKKSGIVLFGGLIFNVLSLLFNLVVARLIGAKVYGQFTYILTFVSLLPMISALGYNNGLVYFIPKFISRGGNNERNSLISFYILSVFGISVLLSGLVFWKSDFIATYLLNKPGLSALIKAMAPLGLLLAFTPVTDGVLIGTGNIKIYNLAQNFIIPFVKIISVLILAFLGLKLGGLIAAMYMANICGFLYLFWNIKNLRLFGGISRKYFGEYKSLLRFSYPLMLASILAFFNSKISTLMIGYYLPVKQVGIFNVALRVGSLSIFFLSIFTSMFAPVISTVYHHGEIKKLGQIFKALTKWIVAGNLVVFSLILLFKNEIMHIFGKEFIGGSTALMIITIGQVVNAGTGSAGMINIMTGHSSYELFCNLVGLILGIGLNYFLIPRYGINGAAITSFVTMSLINIVRLVLVYRDHRIHPYSPSYVKVIGACLFSYLIISGLKNAVHWQWFNELIILSGFYLILFVIFTVIFGLSQDDRIVLDKVLGKLKKPKEGTTL